MSLSALLRQKWFGISQREATFARRGISPCDQLRQRLLESVGAHFICGYNAALKASPKGIPAALSQVEPSMRGFAYEGAAMAFALRDALARAATLGLRQSTLWQQFVQSAAAGHVYMAHVGAGWAAARLPWLRLRIERYLDQFDPLLRWLVIDGYGFHEGYFHPATTLERCQRPRMRGYVPRAFDQGLGRSLWFYCGADVPRVVRNIGRFDESRRGDLWSGVGLASTYAGQISAEDLTSLRRACQPWQDHLSQGSVFGSVARAEAGLTQQYTEEACEILCGLSVRQACELAATTRERLEYDAPVPAYEQWRTRIRQAWSQPTGTPTVTRTPHRAVSKSADKYHTHAEGQSQ